MTVAEVIQVLSQFPPNAKVLVNSNDKPYELDHVKFDLIKAELWPTGIGDMIASYDDSPTCCVIG